MVVGERLKSSDFKWNFVESVKRKRGHRLFHQKSKQKFKDISIFPFQNFFLMSVSFFRVIQARNQVVTETLEEWFFIRLSAGHWTNSGQ